MGDPQAPSSKHPPLTHLAFVLRRLPAAFGGGGHPTSRTLFGAGGSGALDSHLVLGRRATCEMSCIIIDNSGPRR